MNIFIQLIFFLFPWKIRRIFLNKICGFSIAKTAYIGKSIIRSKKVILEEHARIGNLTICKGLDKIYLKQYARLGNLNFVTGFPIENKKHFQHVLDRKCELIIKEHAAVTSRHYIDCTGGVYIGEFTTFAGVGSQILTHSIDLKECRQDAASVTIGKYCFIGTNCVFLKGSILPNYSILGAKSLANKSFENEGFLYGGIPAKQLVKIDIEQYKYFDRDKGFVI